MPYDISLFIVDFSNRLITLYLCKVCDKKGISYRGRKKVEVSNNHRYFFYKSN